MKYLTHERFMDVFVEVLSEVYTGPKYRKLKVRWWNRSQTGNPFPLDIVQTIKIPNEKWKEWRPFVVRPSYV